MKFWPYIFSCTLITLVSGCIGLPISQNNEPETIIIRNSSATYLEEVSIRGNKTGNQYIRVGAISPLPVGVSQIIGRSTNPPRLPSEIYICWGDQAQKEICKQENIKAVLKNPAGTGKALVFEILSLSDVKVCLENKP